MKLFGLLKFALRNVFRQRMRSLATLAAIAIGVSGLILAGGFVNDIFFQLGEAIIHSQTGHIQLTKQGYAEGKYRNPDAFLIEKPDDLKKKILGASTDVDRVMARLTFSGVLNNGRRDLGIIGEGIEADSEAAVGTFLHFIEGRNLNDKDIDGIVVGEGVARSLGLKIGDRVTLVLTLAAGAINTLDYELVGVFQSFSKEFDARAIRITLASAQELMDTPGAHVLVSVLKDTRQTTTVQDLLKISLKDPALEIIAWNKLSDFYDKTVELYDRQFGMLRLIILLMVLLSVANSVNMTLFERTREFGTMRAIGDRSTRIFSLILTEAICLGAIGALIGVSVGIFLAWIISTLGIPMPPPPNSNLGYTAQIRLDTTTVMIAGSIGFVSCILAAIVPARRASRLDVVDALRHGL